MCNNSSPDQKSDPRPIREKWMLSPKSPRKMLPPKRSPPQEPPRDQSCEPMTFYPTMEELASFDTYVAHMESQGAHKAGIARIVPPKNWTARKAGYDPAEVNIVIDNPVQQNIAVTKVPGAFTTIADRSIPPFTLPEYLHLATSPRYLTPSHSSYEELEQLYWQQNLDDSLPAPIYGADVQASLTDPDQAVFNITKLPSILTGMAEKIPGVNLPYLYVGMWKATFSWHVEDMDLYAVNYLHYGAPKTWYCVPPQFGYKLEQIAQKLFPEMSKACFNLLRHKAIMIGPKLLAANGIIVNKVVHEQGSIIVVFPHAYHSGFNHGFNMAESLNFALPRWVEYGKRFRDCLCSNQKRAVRVNMDQFVEKFQPEMLANWKQGDDFALHPEDPEFLEKYWEDLMVKFGLGFIDIKEFEMLKKDLKLKREISTLFKKKFPLDYKKKFPLDNTDMVGLVLEDKKAEETSVDTNHNNYVPYSITCKTKTNFTKKAKIKCFVKIKRLDNKVTMKHLKEAKAYEALLDQHKRDVEAKRAAMNVNVGRGAAKGCGFKGTKSEDLKAKSSLVHCSANIRHKFKACRKCSGCREENCETCIYCLDQARNGGKVVLKQKCVKRVCVNPVVGMCTKCKWQL
eukprot:GFUD01024628.1.p1 GENE.GFUD01024628.1~~GFUD01024628.1.p1  ORF type:complete len:625 (+),score=158.35 GFUD01024628.1:38-1912(+)